MFSGGGGGKGGGGGTGARPGSARSRPGSARSDEVGRLQRQIKELHLRHNEVQHRLAAATEHLEESRDEVHVLRDSLGRSEAMTAEQAMLIELLQSRVDLLERSLAAAHGITTAPGGCSSPYKSGAAGNTPRSPSRADERINAVRQNVDVMRTVANGGSGGGGAAAGSFAMRSARSALAASHGSASGIKSSSRSTVGTYLLKDHESAAAALAVAQGGPRAAVEVSREVQARAY